LNRIKNYQDFIGLNSYFGYHHQVKIISLDRPHQHRSDLGWELFPDAIYYVLKGLRKFNKPVYITENGLADMKDNYREWFIINTLRAVNRAIQDGVDVRGYLHWSLLDNFEWDKGFWPRFGLIEVDYQSQQRTIRPSARAYAEIIKRNSLPG
jgi:beta-glucosidase/6-phospho-beta-glucosidase/beta-galactosidase